MNQGLARIRGVRFPRAVGVLMLIVVSGYARGADPAREDARRREFFEVKVRPVLAARCYSCHGGSKREGGLRVDWRDGLLEGGDSGPAVEPGRPDDSLIVRAVAHDEPGMEMPKNAPRLPEAVVADLRRWVLDGAFDPRDRPPTAEESARVEWESKLSERRGWWSLRRPVRPPVPEPLDRSWPVGPVDRFVRARLEAAGLDPSPPADRAALARRVGFVLTGLPLSDADRDEFLADPDVSPASYERLVDRLLASPHFGERWARHWMDVVRYGDTYGYEWDIPAKGAWRYRDYLVRAFNADVPFDRLVREQIAGDLLDDPRIDPVERINESLAGPMFHQLGEKRHGDSAMFDGIHQEMLHNKVDAFSKAFQGLTIGCARCHDHKLDAISQKDYYALAGALMSPRWVTRTLDAPDRNAEALGRLRALKPPLRKALAAWWRASSAGWSHGLLASRTPAGSGSPWAKARSEAGAEPPWEHPLRAWAALTRPGVDPNAVATVWSALADGYRREAAARAAANSRAFRVVADFRQGVPPGWSVEGSGLSDGPVRPGDFTVALDGPAAVGLVLPGGLYTNALSPRLNGAIRSPYLSALPDPWLSLEASGGDFAADRTVVDNAFLTERQTYLASPGLKWSTTPPLPELAGRKVYRELATKSSNPNFPPRVGLGGACSEAQAAAPQSWFGATRAVAGKAAGVPSDELARFRALFEGPAPVTLAEAAERYAGWFRSALERWANDAATPDDALLLNALLDAGLLPNRSDASAPSDVRALVAAYRDAERRVLDPQTINGMAELDPGGDYRLNVRGEYDQPGPAVPRGYLGVLAGGSTVPDRFHGPGSGRLELAERVASADNPLTARVYVNRVWQWVFGTGLVATPDDFGRIGERPSDPELLDFLAVRFVEDGWSTKRLVRELVRSATFRQGATTTGKARELDPANRLLHHHALRRLEAEEVRDAILAASGRLDRRLQGPPVDPHRSSEDAQKRLFSGPIDGDGRRSLYTKLTIMEPPRWLSAFNQPPPKIPTGRRDVTNVPAQALALLNDPFVIGQARLWGARVARSGGGDVPRRIATMFQTALGRAPTLVESARWRTLVDDLARERGVAADRIAESPAVWADVAHTLFNTKEFLYLR